MKKIFAILALLCGTLTLPAQPQMSATIQNMHLWRGGQVTDGFVMTTDMHYSLLQERLNLGFWGGTNSVGAYKEFNYYASYSAGRLTFAVSDTYNFSDFATYNNDRFFDYNPATTGRFLDAKLQYTIGDQNPLVLTWATVLFGRDRDSANSTNRYSTYCSVEYPIYNHDEWQISAGAGGAFALRSIDGSTANFYGDKAGIIEATLKVSRPIVINNYNIPLQILMMWNPQSEQAYMQLSAQILRF